MTSYHVFFTAKLDVDEPRLVSAVHEFMRGLLSEKQIAGYRVLRVTNPASFQGMPRFQLIMDCVDQAQLDAAMASMRPHEKVHGGPHGEIVRSVSDFKVCFSEDA